MSRSDGEENLVTKAINGNREAFGALYDHYRSVIYRFLLRKVDSHELAEDLMQQSFLRAFENIHTYKNQGNQFSSWLYSIARNQTIDFIRTRKDADNLEEAEIKNASLFATTLVPEDEVESEKVHRALECLVQNLKFEYRTVLSRRFFEDRPIAEVAIEIGKNEGAVRVIQNRAIKELKKMLGKL